jgi:hypothetical protein
MTVSANVLELLITISTALVAIAPVILVFLWLKDKKGGKLW